MSTNKQRKQYPMQSATGTSVGKKVAQSTNKSKHGTHRSNAFASSRTNVLSSASRRSMGGAVHSDRSGGTTAAYKPPVQVFNESGEDVTPLPLMSYDTTGLKSTQSKILDTSGGTPTDLMSQTSVYTTAMTTSTFAGGPFTRSVFSQSQSGATESIADDITEPTVDIVSAWADIRHRRAEEAKEDLTDHDLEQPVMLTLTETDTIWLLNIPGICVPSETEESATITDKNSKYIQLVTNRVGNDRYVERGMNTFNEPPKYKNIQTTKVIYNNVEVTATNWDMYDTYDMVNKETKGVGTDMDLDDRGEGTISQPVSEVHVGSGEAHPNAGTGTVESPTQAVSSAGPGRNSAIDSMAGSFAGSDIFANKDADGSTQGGDSIEKDHVILKSENLKRDLFVMERAVNLNTYQPKQALYRGYSVVENPDKVVEEGSVVGGPVTPVTTAQIRVADMGPNLDRLWSYSCSLTKGRNVSCIAWNRVNPDLVAVGYGQFDFTNQKSGIVCCWCLKNPEYPERIYTCPYGVTAVNFSLANSNLLAVGLYNGAVVIYNVRKSKDESVLDNLESPNKHTSPVWQLEWIEKERGSGEERTEVLVSMSTDGRATQWSIRKGFESYDLMRLKKLPTRMQGKGKERKGEAFISRYAGGFCFDFNPVDSNIYLAGTEEGFVHKCSCSYNEQYLDTYTGHTAPVYKIAWSPFAEDLFLSCSADWSIRLWHQDRPNPVLNFYSSTKAVFDLCWSPRSSTMFACVNEGAVEVWDLAVSTLDPIIVNTPISDAKLTSVAFARNSEYVGYYRSGRKRKVIPGAGYESWYEPPTTGIPGCRNPEFINIVHLCILVGDSEGQVSVFQLRCIRQPPVNQAETLKHIIRASLASQLKQQKQQNDKGDWLEKPTESDFTD